MFTQKCFKSGHKGSSSELKFFTYDVNISVLFSHLTLSGSSKQQQHLNKESLGYLNPTQIKNVK